MQNDSAMETILQNAVCGLARILDKSHVRVFMFHRFSEGDDPRKTSAAVFRAQLELLKTDYTPVQFSEAAEAISSGKRMRRPYACVTVDDGHADFFHIAWPILRELEVPATVFVTTSFMDGKWLWTDALEYMMFNAVEDSYQVVLPSGKFAFRLTADERGRREIWRRVAADMKWNNQVREKVLADMASALSFQLPESPVPTYASMGWDKVRELADNGIEIGAHTVSHSFLPGLSDSALDLELRGARLQIEEQISRHVSALAYPNGSTRDVNDRVIKAAQDSGYSCAAVAYKPCPGDSSSDLFRIGRWPAGNDMRSFRYALSGATHIKRRIRHFFGRGHSSCP